MLTKKLKDRLYAYFTNRMGMFDYTRGWLKGNCPSCGAENKFGVNLSQNRTHCFRCEYVDPPIDVVGMVENLDSNETKRYLNGIEGIEYKDPIVIEYERKPVNLPKGYCNLREGDHFLGTLARRYIRGRGFDVKKLSRKGFGYCSEGPLFGYLVLPYYLNGELVYYSTRRLLSIGPKFDNPKIEDFGIGKSSLIYNIDALNYYGTVYVVESVFNAETIGDNAIALAGKSISPWQISTIIRAPAVNFIILLDPDAYLYAIDLAMQLLDYKRVKVVGLPEGEDVNSYGREATLLKVRRTRYQNYADLMKLKNDYQRAQHTHNQE
jgi:DNA primase